MERIKTPQGDGLGRKSVFSVRPRNFYHEQSGGVGVASHESPFSTQLYSLRKKGGVGGFPQKSPSHLVKLNRLFLNHALRIKYQEPKL
jgi:hypothetical protein